MQESPTLDLAIDCSRFVTQHFEVISASSPHIYHSALVLTPTESILRKIYKPHVQPFVRAVHGTPASWDPTIASTKSPFPIHLAVWSPCHRFIATSPWHTAIVDILDSATLQRLQSLEFSPRHSIYPGALAFSPDSRTLTSFVRQGDHLNILEFVVTWDLQTGSAVRVIERERPFDTRVGDAQMSYLMDGKMIAVLSRYESSTIISIHDVVSGVYMHDVDHGPRTNLDLDPGAPYVYKIWAHGKSLRFATPEPTGITIWEVGLAPGATPIEVETVSVPDNTVETFAFKPRTQRDIAYTEFHPASCRLAFIGTGGILMVWDARATKFLLHNPGNAFYRWMSFSPDSRFFACSTTGFEAYLWKESPTGYTLFEKLPTGFHHPNPCFSQNGESVITFSHYTIQLWHMKRFTTITSSPLTQTVQPFDENFVLEFLPDRSLAIVARKEDDTVTVLDLRSGVPQLTIDTSIEVYGLRAVNNTIVVIGGEKAITWNLPGGNSHPTARMTIEDSTRTINFRDADHSTRAIAASISIDFQYIALSWHDDKENFLDVYCTSTGRNLCVETEWKVALWFAPDGHNIWCADENGAEVITITQDALDYNETWADIEDGSCPWGPSRGYGVTDDGWILGGGGKRLLMLPPLWRSPRSGDQVWNGQFLALLHGGLPEPVILELEQ